MTLTAIIPARAGSKRIKDKNQQVVGGRSLLKRAIDNAHNAADRIIVSSDDPDYLQYASAMGCETHERSDAAAQDSCHAVFPVLEAIEDMNVQGWVAMMLPTAPFVSAVELLDAYGLALKHDAPAIISVIKKRVTNLYVRPANGAGIERMFPDELPENQDAETCYVVTGEIFIAKVDALKEHRSFHMPGVRGFIQANARDIDDYRDLDAAREYAA